MGEPRRYGIIENKSTVLHHRQRTITYRKVSMSAPRSPPDLADDCRTTSVGMRQRQYWIQPFTLMHNSLATLVLHVPFKAFSHFSQETPVPSTCTPIRHLFAAASLTRPFRPCIVRRIRSTIFHISGCYCSRYCTVWCGDVFVLL